MTGRPANVPVRASNFAEWARGVALAVNTMLNRDPALPFQALATAPASPSPGATYYDTATNKVRTWDGTAWRDHW